MGRTFHEQPFVREYRFMPYETITMKPEQRAISFPVSFLLRGIEFRRRVNPSALLVEDSVDTHSSDIVEL